MAGKREELKFQAKLAEQAERFNDMVGFMREIVENDKDKSELNEEERNLLSVAYKNVIGSRRSAWRVYNASILKEEKEEKKAWCKKLKEDVEKEITEHCNEIINLLDKQLIDSKSDNVQAQVFYLKMKGDYLRYRVEITESGSSNEKELKEQSSLAYTKANELAVNLKATSPIRLGLALNYSVFFYEIESNAEKACEMAKTAFDNAIAELDDVSEDVYKDSTLIMQLLRDNLTLWTSEMEESQEKQDIEN